MFNFILTQMKGKKTYAFIVAYAAYQYAVNHGYMAAMPDLETALLTGAGLSLRSSIKNEKEATV